jgi:hypothetical protein
MSDNFVYAKRPWSASEIENLRKTIASHEPLRTLVHVEPVWRKRARLALDIEPELLADVLGISVEDLLRFESDPKLLSDESNATYRSFICASAGFADAIRPPDRYGHFRREDVLRWQAAAKHVPSNPLKTDDDMVVG